MTRRTEKKKLKANREERKRNRTKTAEKSYPDHTKACLDQNIEQKRRISVTHQFLNSRIKEDRKKSERKT